MRNIRDTCSTVEMLKGYMARERLGTNALNEGKVFALPSLFPYI